MNLEWKFLQFAYREVPETSSLSQKSFYRRVVRCNLNACASQNKLQRNLSRQNLANSREVKVPVKKSLAKWYTYMEMYSITSHIHEWFCVKLLWRKKAQSITTLGSKSFLFMAWHRSISNSEHSLKQEKICWSICITNAAQFIPILTTFKTKMH